MKRILSVLAVAALLVAMLLATALPAFAQANHTHQTFGCNSSAGTLEEPKCHENFVCEGFQFCPQVMGTEPQ